MNVELIITTVVTYFIRYTRHLFETLSVVKIVNNCFQGKRIDTN